MDLHKQVNTAGAFLLVKGLFAFMVGPNEDGDLGVVRLGGHKENNETPIECLRRELEEEAAIRVAPVNSPVTYHVEEWGDEPIVMEENLQEHIAPIVIKGKVDGKLSILYFAYSEEEPKPSCETNGILFLSLEDIELICKGAMTIRDFLEKGGKAIFQRNLKQDVTLKPGVHLDFLYSLIKKHGEVIDSLMERRLYIS